MTSNVFSQESINYEELPRTRTAAVVAGSRYYFTGDPCKNGHKAPRYTSAKTCAMCAYELAEVKRATIRQKLNEAQRLFYARHREEMAERARKYRSRDPEGRNKKRREEYAENLAQERERKRQWKIQNREKVLAANRAWYAKNAEKSKKTSRDWQKANPDYVLTNTRNRRARRSGAEGAFTQEDISGIRKAQHDKCAYCRKKLLGKGHVDHIIALVNGGSNWPRNLQLLCQPCNSSKHARDPVEFAQSRGMII
jgi:5-methylcytosine-specific restriction endonuclease McrA